jgi:hypothetical protein
VAWLAGVVRRPSSEEERAANCDLVLAELSKRVDVMVSGSLRQWCS